MNESPNRVQIGEKLRQDATGAWHRATLAGRGYTLRILREDLAGEDDARLVFEQEMRRIRGLQHPGLLRVHESGAKPPRPWLLTDPVDGKTLEARLAEEGPLPPAEALALATSVHAALRYLQERNQVHAAPWPSHLVRVEDGWRLTTFRDIRAVDGLKSLKRRSDRYPQHTPPERKADHPARLRIESWISWAVGTVLQAASGEGAPAGLRAAVERLRAPDPDRRPAGERAVTALLSGADGSAPPAPAPLVRKRRRGRT